MFGLRQRETGITKYPVRNRQRVVTYAVTLAFQKYDPSFVLALKSHLIKVTNLTSYPTSKSLKRYFDVLKNSFYLVFRVFHK